MAFKAIKYAIYPTEDQKLLLAQTFGACRVVYNRSLEIENGLYEAGMPSLSKNGLNNLCNSSWKFEDKWLIDVDKFALTNSIYAACDARKNFFEGRARYPKFHTKKGRQSYTTNYTNGNIKIIPDTVSHIQIPKIGRVETRLHRLPKKDWKIKSATISLMPSGKYFCSVLFEYDLNLEKKPVLCHEDVLGIDYSSPNFAVFSDGTVADAPHYYRKAEAKLAKEQKKLSRMKKGSKNYEKQNVVVARTHEHVTNQRKDFIEKLSTEIANSYNAVSLETLDLHAQAQSLHFGKAVADNGFGLFRNRLQQKLNERGGTLVYIDKWYPSTKTCNYCGTYNPDIMLGVSFWECPCCGQYLDRDANASFNIRDEGFKAITLQRINVSA